VHCRGVLDLAVIRAAGSGRDGGSGTERWIVSPHGFGDWMPPEHSSPGHGEPWDLGSLLFLGGVEEFRSGRQFLGNGACVCGETDGLGCANGSARGSGRNVTG